MPRITPLNHYRNIGTMLPARLLLITVFTLGTASCGVLHDKSSSYLPYTYKAQPNSAYIKGSMDEATGGTFGHGEVIVWPVLIDGGWQIHYDNETASDSRLIVPVPLSPGHHVITMGIKVPGTPQTVFTLKFDAMPNENYTIEKKVIWTGGELRDVVDMVMITLKDSHGKEIAKADLGRNTKTTTTFVPQIIKK